MWNLFIDDERIPKTTDRTWVIARSVEEAISLIEAHGCPNYISFDHDLGCNSNQEPLSTGYDFAHWLVKMDMDNKYPFPENFSFFVHSANPQGAANIQGLLDRYLKFKKENI